MKFLQKVLSYAIGSGLSKFIAVIILPIYTNYLNPYEYGKADLVYYTVSIVVSFVFMECWTALLRFIYDDYTEENRKTVFSNICFFTVILIVPYMIIQYMVSKFIASEYAWLSVIYGVVYMVLQIMQMYSRAIKKSQYYVMSGIISSVIQLLIAYLLVVIMGEGASSLLIAPTIGAVLATVYLIITTKCWQDISKKLVDKKLLRKMYKFSIPLAFNSIAFWAMNNINRYFAAYFIGYEASSFISIASKLTMVIMLAASVYSLAWQEEAFENSNNKDRKIVYSKMFRIYVAIFSTATVCSILFVKFIFPFIIGKEYAGVLNLLPLYFIAVYFSGVNAFLGQIFSAEKKTSILLTSTITGTIINVFTAVIFVNRFGLTAIILGSVFSYLTCLILRYIKLHKIVDMNIPMKDIVKAVFLICLSLIMFQFQKGISSFTILLIIIIILIITLYRDILKEFLNEIKKRKRIN